MFIHFKFPYMLMLKKFSNLHLKFGKSKNYVEKKGAHCTPLLLQTLKQRLIEVISFSLSKSLYSRFAPFNAIIILVLFFQILWITEFTRPNSRHTSALFFPFYISRVTLRVPSKVKPFLLLVTAAMQSLCLQLTAGIDKQRVTLCTE